MRHNLLLDTDSYKFSHFLQDPEGLTAKTFYLESRGGDYPYTVFFGLQYILKQLSQGICLSDIAEAQEIARAHGEPFNEQGFIDILRNHGGHIPLRICAVPEGTIVPTGNVLMTVENTDKTMPWLGGFFETMLMRVWYPTTVATRSHFLRGIIQEALRVSSDAPDAEINFKLHDFGARGVSSRESAGIGGLAHLVNFLGTDTVEALSCAKNYYNAEPVAGFSIPAAEHATILAWGRKNEAYAYDNMLDKFAKKGALLAVVSDTYDLWKVIREYWCCSLRDKVIESGATLVIRPDSGNPPEVVVRTLQELEKGFGSQKNSKGFKVLNHVRVIQGDGITEKSLPEIIDAVLANGFSMTNVAFGMGGGLLQQLNRDTLKFAYKPCMVWFGEDGLPVSKCPVDAPWKNSKEGLLDLVRVGGKFETVDRLKWLLSNHGHGVPSELIEVFCDGKLLVDDTLENIRKRATNNE